MKIQQKLTLTLKRLFVWAICSCTVALFVLQAYAIADIENFEWEYLFGMLGGLGLAMVIFLNAGLATISFRLARHMPLYKGSVISTVFLSVWLFSLSLFCDWIFLETPVSLRLSSLIAQKSIIGGEVAAVDVQRFSDFGQAAKPEILQVMLDRIRLNNPDLYARNGIVETVTKYSQKYGVDPALFFYLNYIDSFYGNAVVGPIPFFHAVTPETFRDLVQVHLPTFVVESGVRKYLAETDLFRNAFGPILGMKLNYLFQKFTLDASLAPYALNIFSDVLLVLREYPNEFPELTLSITGDALETALQNSYKAIASTALKTPYENPYSIAPYDNHYYDAHRKDMKKFARAIFYKLMFDFDFATRVQALLAKYNEKIVITAIGDERWQVLPDFQRLAILAMPRDLFVPNVGKVSYNAYALPELNCTTIEFVANEARRDLKLMDSNNTWRPQDSDKLWAGAGYRLRVLAEVWFAFHGNGSGFPGINPTTTVNEARWRLLATSH